MNDSRLPEEDHAASSGTLGARHFLLIAIILVVGVGGLYYWSTRSGGDDGGPVPSPITVVPEGSRTVTLFFADADDPILVTESRQVAIGRDFETQMRQVIRALAAGPDASEHVGTIPDGTELLAAFYEPEQFTVYLDFSGEFVAGHPGGSTAEYFTVSAIMKTISENFPEVQAVQILVEGSQVGTIAGHIDASAPFLVRHWR